jgi:hypothetical protein
VRLEVDQRRRESTSDLVMPSRRCGRKDVKPLFGIPCSGNASNDRRLVKCRSRKVGATSAFRSEKRMKSGRTESESESESELRKVKSVEGNDLDDLRSTNV